MDDGTPIKLSVNIDINDGSALFDFTGTGPEVSNAIIILIINITCSRLTVTAMLPEQSSLQQ